MAESDTSVPLIPQSKVLTLKGVQPGRKKVGRDERLSDHKFTEKYWEKCTASYDLSHEISKEDDDESESIENYSKHDEEISEDNNEEETNQAEFNHFLDVDTPMAHAEDLS
ncbi:hypothetical protein O181_045008 [Austropuccinia psidii MF-1]|uniref:Uncharacterized protein n=1 Tax=Austropuccinia psidii MF-1 TaxID=1389203 RepID=A0A9Q3DPF3_9BASI|nr:hypothetical protein [Austropuccinia psidii MF-1]